jgi:hypothetical protein
MTPSTIYVCSRSWFPGAGDLFKSVDGGRSWKAISSVVGAASVVIMRDIRSSSLEISVLQPTPRNYTTKPSVEASGEERALREASE